MPIFHVVAGERPVTFTSTQPNASTSQACAGESDFPQLLEAVRVKAAQDVS
jgi:hypothetical protein